MTYLVKNNERIKSLLSRATSLPITELKYENLCEGSNIIIVRV
jgi:hypothetical protein